MTTEEAILSFIVGFLRAAFIAFLIALACFYNYSGFSILITGLIGGVMTMKLAERGKPWM